VSPACCARARVDAFSRRHSRRRPIPRGCLRAARARAHRRTGASRTVGGHSAARPSISGVGTPRCTPRRQWTRRRSRRSLSTSGRATCANSKTKWSVWRRSAWNVTPHGLVNRATNASRCSLRNSRGRPLHGQDQIDHTLPETWNPNLLVAGSQSHHRAPLADLRRDGKQQRGAFRDQTGTSKGFALDIPPLAGWRWFFCALRALARTPIRLWCDGMSTNSRLEPYSGLTTYPRPRVAAVRIQCNQPFAGRGHLHERVFGNS